MLEVTRELARFISDLEFEDIQPEDIGPAKTLMHDFVGSAYAPFTKRIRPL